MSESPDKTALAFTGERFTPECVREIWYEHWHRYAFASRLATGKRVLDAACGEGYGSAMLAGTADSVLGVDIDPVAIEHARGRYGQQPNLSYVAADVTALDLPAASFDLIVSFETLEHVHEQERMIDGFARVLKPDGLLIISSPDKATYSDAIGHQNPHHVRELYRNELEALLKTHFPALRLLAQKLVFQSFLWDVDAQPSIALSHTADSSGRAEPGLNYPALYYVALCARRPSDLPQFAPALWTFGDAAESVYAHYNQEIRKIIAAGHQIIEQDAEIQRLRQALAEANARAATPSEQESK